MKRSLLLFVVALGIISCNNKIADTTPIKKTVLQTRSNATTSTAKNIILVIGDGMGLGQITAGMYANGNKTVLEDFPVVGLHKCYASDKLITDSAAAATAFASGIKTYNGAIGVDPDTISVPTILEEAEDKGLATGLVATSTIVHATPASFIAHNKARGNYEEIAADFLDTEVDIMIGGGKKFFNNRETDKRDLYQELRAKNYVVKDFLGESIQDLSIGQENFAYFTANAQPLPAAQGRSYLTSATSKSIEFLDDRSAEGFFLMVEGSQIDWGGHANNSDYIITEFIDFDKMLKEVLDYAKADGNTLVVVTADHETGGYAIQYESQSMDSLVTAFTSDYHTGTMIPVFAYGPGAEKFAGIYENTAIYHKMKEAYGWFKTGASE